MFPSKTCLGARAPALKGRWVRRPAQHGGMRSRRRVEGNGGGRSVTDCRKKGERRLGVPVEAPTSEERMSDLAKHAAEGGLSDRGTSPLSQKRKKWGGGVGGIWGRDLPGKRKEEIKEYGRGYNKGIRGERKPCRRGKPPKSRWWGKNYTPSEREGTTKALRKRGSKMNVKMTLRSAVGRKLLV